MDGVSRTSVNNIYATGDCTGVYPLASVVACRAASRWRISWVTPCAPCAPTRSRRTSSPRPKLATVGISENDLHEGSYRGEAVTFAAEHQPRAKMMAMRDGFVKVSPAATRVPSSAVWSWVAPPS